MPVVKMNTLWLSILKPPGKRVEYSDETTPGLRLRVGKTSMVWNYVYKPQGGRSLRRVTIGPYPSVSLAEARKKAIELRAKVYAGEDPAAEKQQEKHLPAFEELAAEYLAKYAIHKRSYAEDKRIVTRELIPSWGKLRVDRITKRQVLSLLDEIVARGAPVMANRTLALISKIFNWAIDRDILSINPCFRLKRPAQEISRDRWLNDDEIRAVWEAFESETACGPIFKILLLTGRRKSEVQAMRWNEIDLDAGIWTIPPERSKNKRAHVVPLSQPVLEILYVIPRKSIWVFPSPRPRCGHISNTGKAHQRVKNLSGVNFHIHDLRRSCATGMARLGVDRVVISKVLNHADRSVTAIYERHGYDAEKRHALELWAEHVMRVIRKEPAKVITLPTR